MDRVVVAGEELSIRFGEEGREDLSAPELADVVRGFRGEDGS
jgi:hypothetical protein